MRRRQASTSVTITATDSDGATTQLDIVINVLGINPPSIDVTSPTGEEFGICAGAELGVVANSQGGDEPVSRLELELEQFVLERQRGHDSIRRHICRHR